MFRWLRRRLCPPPPLPSETPEGAEVLAELRAAKLLDCLTYLSPASMNPVDHIGTALRLAGAYHIQLQGGITYGSCIASLPKEYWERELPVTYLPAGDWIDRIDPKEAICVCLLSCYKLGLLKAIEEVAVHV